ncbi:hypothetical protein B0H12DRAFT_1155160 [Mycena haematopus]|nr:hypothetical protein B0H12DRAFT_1155160 [Mycena haematopus]
MRWMSLLWTSTGTSSDAGGIGAAVARAVGRTGTVCTGGRRYTIFPARRLLRGLCPRLLSALLVVGCYLLLFIHGGDGLKMADVQRVAQRASTEEGPEHCAQRKVASIVVTNVMSLLSS